MLSQSPDFPFANLCSALKPLEVGEMVASGVERGDGLLGLCQVHFLELPLIVFLSSSSKVGPSSFLLVPG